MYIFAGSGNRIEGPALWLDWGGQERDGVGFEEFQNVGGHLRLHLVELLVLGGRVHFEGTGVAVAVLRLPSQGSRKPVGVGVHVVIMLLHFIRAIIIRIPQLQYHNHIYLCFLDFVRDG